MSSLYEQYLLQLGTRSAAGTGTAIFYSGTNPNGLRNQTLAEQCQVANPTATYTIHNTAAGEFLDGVVTQAFRNGALSLDEYNRLWEHGSKMFAQQARGDVIAFVNGNLRPGATFKYIELPTLLRNIHVTSINGIPLSPIDRIAADPEILTELLAPLSDCFDPKGPPPTASAPVTEDIPNLWPYVLAIAGGIVGGAVASKVPGGQQVAIRTATLLSITAGTTNSTAEATEPGSNNPNPGAPKSSNGYKFETPLLQHAQLQTEAILQIASKLVDMKLKGLVVKGKIPESALQELPQGSGFGYASWKTGRVSSNNLIIGKVTHTVTQEDQYPPGAKDPQKPPVQPQSGDTGQLPTSSGTGGSSLGQPTILAPKPPAIIKVKPPKPKPKSRGWFSDLIGGLIDEIFRFISNPMPNPQDYGSIPPTYNPNFYSTSSTEANIGRDRSLVAIPNSSGGISYYRDGIQVLPSIYSSQDKPPLVLDLQNNGVETLSYEQSNAQFDMQGDGFLHKTSWVSKNDALLAIDRNQNNIIDDVNEIFGWLDKTGFDELRALDTNQDNIIDSHDAEFSSLRSWQDANEDGITDTGELKTLTEAGIRSIELTTRVENFDNNGNHVSESATFTKTDGTTSKIYDVFFTSSNTYTQSKGAYQISTDLILAPWIRGYGLVKDLLVVASDTPALKTLVLNLSTEANAKTIYSQIDQLLSLWAGTPLAGQVPTGQYDPGKAEFIEKFLGLNIALEGNSVESINQSYQDLKNKIFVDFIAQTPIGFALGINYDFVSDQYILDNNIFYDQLLESLSDIQTSFTAYIIGTTLADAEVLNIGLLSDAIYRHGYGDFLNEFLNKKTDFIAQNADGSVTGNENANLLYSTSTTGVLIQGNEGHDVLASTVGNDTLQGGTGNDAYILDLKSGEDLITDDSGIDQLILGAGITKENLILSRNGADLKLSVGDHLLTTIQNFYTTGTVEKISFTDGTSLNGIDILTLTTTISGSSAAETLNGSNFDDTILGDGGNDSLSSGAGNDTMSGGSGSDIVDGGYGDDSLSGGGSGNDTLRGSYGNDVLSGGDGSDVMEGGSGNDLYVVENTGDSVIENAIAGIDTVQSSLSYTLGANVENLTLTGIDNLNATGNELDNILTANSGTNILTGKAGNDTYILDSTSDTIVENAGEGTDTVQIESSYTLGNHLENLTITGTTAVTGTGNSLDNILTGNDAASTLIGGAGNDLYHVQNTGSVVTENANEGTDTIQSSVSYALSANVENLTLTGSTALSGTGNSLGNVLTSNNAASTLTGGAGNDTYIVTNGNTVIAENVGEGVDSVLASTFFALNAELENLTLTGSNAIDGTGNALNNQIIGNVAANILDGGAGADTLVGGIGNDTYIVDQAGDVVTELVGEGTDTVQANSSYTLGDHLENLTLTGTTALSGTGNHLNNTLVGNNAASTLAGTLGDDTYVIQHAGTVITENANEGTDTIQSSVSYTLGAHIENLTLTGNTAVSGVGNSLGNVLTGNTAASTLAGGTGNDTYVIQHAGTVITENANEGTDTVQTSVSYTLEANLENLTLTGNSAIHATGNSLANILTGNSADNTLDGAAGIDTLVGGLGNDTYIVDNTADIITEQASEGIDTVQASVSYTLDNFVENLTLSGTNAITGTGSLYHNQITGNTAANLLRGMDGHDTLDGGLGNDTLLGGTGNDLYVVDNAGDVIHESLNEGLDTVQSSINWTLGANTENLTLTGNTALTGTGNSLDNILTGNNAIDTLSGGAGNDTYILQNANTLITENAAEGIDTVQVASSYTLGANLENLTLTGTAALTGTGNVLDNVITGNSGLDTLVGGAGNDTYVISNSNTVITENSSEGTDTVQASDSYTLGTNLEHLTLTGSRAINATGNTLNNVITGNQADNVLSGGTGADTLIGKDGNDTYIVDNVSDVVTEQSGEGSDTVQSSITYTLSQYLENLALSGTSAINGTGNEYQNILQGNSGNNKLTGLGGNDTLDGGAGNDTLLGGTGDDIYRVDSPEDVISENLSEGTDTIISSANHTLADHVEHLSLSGDTATLGVGNNLENWIKGNSAHNTLKGFEGNDTLDGGTGNDTLTGGTGDDLYLVDSANDSVVENGNEGTDTVQSAVTYTLDAHVENLVLTGLGIIDGTGNTSSNILVGNSRSNTLVGMAGHDTLDGGAGADSLIGGTGDDLYIIDNSGDVITENANEGTDSVQASVSHTLSTNLENITLTGTRHINATGNSANNTIIGNSGNNILDGQTGADILIGGAGNDTYFIDNVNDTVIENTTEGTDTVQSKITYTLGHQVENLILAEGAGTLSGTGNTLNNIVLGNESANTLTGLAGDDTLDGGAGNDTLKGGSGNDTYYVDSTSDVITELSAEGTDTVYADVNYTLAAQVENLILTGTSDLIATGNSLDNTLTGNSGVDTLIGGLGNDTYVVQNTATIITENAGEGTDTVQTSESYTLGANLENLTLTGFSNINATGNSASNVLTGNAGDNILDGGSGADTHIGGLGDDTYIVHNTGDVVTENANEGIDTVQTSLNYTLGANVENLTLVLNNAVTASGNTQDNIITGNNAASTLMGGAGNDTYVVQNAATIVTENAAEGNDTVQSNVDYSLGANVENLTLTGSANLTATGNSLDNVLTGNTGNSTLAGGLGNDTYVIQNTTTVITENAGEGTDTVQTSESYTLGANLENLTLTGVSAVNGIGNSASNVLIGNFGNNTLSGLDGNDTLDGGGGEDTLIGGLGNDTYIINNSDVTIQENSGQGTDTVQAGIGYTLSAHVENLILTGLSDLNGTGNTLNNTLTGNIGNNTLDGSSGADTLVGGQGNDTYVVDNAGDVVTENANEGIDTVQASINYTLGTNVENLTLTGASNLIATGHAGNNILTGNGGNSTLIGGLGNDTYIVQNSTTTITENLNEGTDTVQASIQYTLGANLENLTLTSSNALLATGNSLDNVLTGNSAASTLAGGAGNDTYVIHSQDTAIAENLNEGTDTVQTDVHYTLSANLENLTLTGINNINGTGNNANNILTGNSGINTLVALDGNDTLDGGIGADFLYGGLGNDTYLVDNLGDLVVENANEGIDTVQSRVTYTLTSNVENLTLTGTSGISGKGNTLNNTLTGNIGNNTLDGSVGADTLIGGQGNDTYIVDNAGDLITENANEGIDTVQSNINYTLGTNIENLTLTGTTNLTGTGNTLDNILTGNAGNSTLAGGTGNDTYILQNSTTVITENASAGTDTVKIGHTYTLGANLENLVLTGTDNINGTGNSANNQMTGNSGDNTLDGGSGTDTLIGGLGNDTYIVDNNSDVITELAGQGVDTVLSSASYTLSSFIENLTLTGTNNVYGTGNTADNKITGNSAGNTLSGGDGNDTLDGGAGADNLIGGKGDDLYIVDNASDSVNENGSEGVDTVQASISYTLANYFENLTLTGTANLSGTGTIYDNVITGNSGNNVLNALAGNDTLDGGTGVDTMTGGTGDDTYYVDNVGDVINENYGEGIDTVISSINYILSANLNNLILGSNANLNGTGNKENNLLIGNTADNLLDGAAGLDTLMGSQGNDTYMVDNTQDVVMENANEGIDTVQASVDWALGDHLEYLALTGNTAMSAIGNSLDNLIVGNSQSNHIDGFAGNDTLDGGAGADTLTGGTGNDTYYVDSISDIVVENTGEGTDTVYSSVTYGLGQHSENITLTGSANVDAIGNTLDNILSGNSGNNWLKGGSGNDTYIFEPGSGTDTIEDSAGVDTLDFSAYRSGLNLNLNNTSLYTVLAVNPTNQKSAWNLNATPDGSVGISDLYNNLWTVYDGLEANQNVTVQSGGSWKAGEKYVYLDGLNDSIKTTAVKPTGNNWTLRWRARMDRLSGYQTILGGNNSYDLKLRFASDRLYAYMSSSGGSWNLASGAMVNKTDWKYYQWYDMEFSYSNTTGYKLFVDGQQVYTNTNTARLYNDMSGFFFGGGTDDPLAGAIADVYFTNSEVLHNSNFTPSADSYMSQFPISMQPKSAWYLNEAVNGSTAISDLYGKLWTTANGASIQSTNPWKSGEKHIVLDGVNDVVKTTVMSPNSNNWTLHWRQRFDTLPTSNTFTLMRGINLRDLALLMTNSGLSLYGSSDNNNWNIFNGLSGQKNTWQTNQWYDFEISYSSTAGYKVFVDGVLDINSSTTTKTYNMGGISLGAKPDGSGSTPGAIADVYFTNTEVLHTTNFTPSTTTIAEQNFASTISWGANTIENLIGGAGNDTITGSTGHNVLTGGAGNDQLLGGSGNDTYRFASGFGTDSISDTAGTDTLDFSAFTSGLNVNLSNTFFTESPGHTVSWGANTIENLITGSGDDSVTGNSNNNILNTGKGNDTLMGGSGNDTLIGGDGNDTYYLTTGFGTDVIQDSTGVNTLDLSSLSGNVSVDLSSTAFTESTGNTVSWTAGTLQGAKTGSGNDTLLGSTGNNLLFGGAGNDSLSSGDGHDTLVGEAGNDTLDGGVGNDTYQFAATFGTDTIIDAGGIDTLDLTALTTAINLSLSNTSYTASTGNTISWSANTMENILGGSGNDTLSGSTGDNLLLGGTGNDTLDGGAGNDTYLYKAGFGVDTITDGSGIDTLDFSTLATSLTVNLNSTGTTESTGNTLTWSANALENIISGSGNDTLIGTAAHNQLTGGKGNDTLDGGTGNDTLHGGAGDDTYILGAAFGTDTVSDSSGEDTLDFSTLNQDILFSLMNTSYQASVGHVVSWTSGQIENVKTGSGNDHVEGSSADNLIMTGTGHDTLSGGAGNDTLQGGAGNDTYVFASGFGVDQITDTSGTDTFDFSSLNTALTFDLSQSNYSDANGNMLLWTPGQIENLTTGSGNDSLSGDAQNNILSAGLGNDSLMGNGGHDLLKGGAGDDIYIFKPGSGNDTIDDASGSDTIDLSAYTSNLTVDLNATSMNVPLGMSGDSNQFSALNLNTQADGSTTLPDYFGNTWTVTGNAAVGSTAPWKAGEKLITLDGNGDSIKTSSLAPTGNNWTIRWRQRFDQFSGYQTILSANRNNTMKLMFSSSYLTTYLSSNGSSWDIALDVNTSKTNWVANQWYEFEFSYSNTSGYKIFVDGQQVWQVNSTAKLYNTQGLVLGAENTLENPAKGALSDFYFTNQDTLHSANFTPLSTSYVESLKDVISWNAGALENAITGSGSDVLIGTVADNQLTGGAGNDSLAGGAGNDTYHFAAGFGVDTINDASGTDTLDFSNFTSALNIDLSTNAFTQSTGNSITWDLNTIENLTTGSGSDTLTGNGIDNILNAGSGNNTLIGGAGNDTLIGGIDNDLYKFANGYGLDTVIDEAGINTLDFSALTDALNYNGQTGQASSNGSAVNWNTATTSITKMLGGTGNDSIVGSTGNDNLNGGAGNDILDGGVGNDVYTFNLGFGADTLIDASGTDTLDFNSFTAALNYNGTLGRVTVSTDIATWDTANTSFEKIIGSSGKNILTGGNGNETLIGGNGNDTITGGLGNDLLQGSLGNDRYTVNLGDGLDIIDDNNATPGNLDTLVFGNGIDATNVAVFMSNNDLQIGFTNSAGDLITIQGQAQEATTIERLQLSDGRYMSDADLNQVLQAMTSYAQAQGISLTSLNDVKNNQDLMNLVTAGWHN